MTVVWCTLYDHTYIYIYDVETGSKRNLRAKAMAPHSSTLAWKIPWMEDPGRL